MGQPVEDGAVSTPSRDGCTAASANVGPCQDPTSLASSQGCYFWPVRCFQGLGWTCVPVRAAPPRSQAVWAGSWLAEGKAAGAGGG